MAAVLTPAPKAAFVDRVAAQATTVAPMRLLVTVVTLPFYVLGWVLGILWVAVLFMVGAVRVGMADARQRLDRRPAVSPDGDG